MLKQEKITAEVLHEFIDINEFTSALDSVMDGELPTLIIHMDMLTSKLSSYLLEIPIVFTYLRQILICSLLCKEYYELIGGY